MSQRTIVAVVAAFVGTAAVAQETADDTNAESTGIAPQALSKALEEFADKSGLQIIYVTELAEGKESRGADPNLSDTATLDQLLASTDLEYRFLNENTVTVQAAADAGEEAEPGKRRPTSNLVLVPQNQSASAQEERRPMSATGQNDEDDDALPFDEIVVTGTHIAGIAPTGAPLSTFDREDIRMSGQPTFEDFMRTLTQNFAPDVGATSTGTSFVNLRGLGRDATLTLLNGRRMAPASKGGGSDIGGIPSAMVERVEILTDGASALYGSDAIGGVVNIVLRKDFDSAETSLRYSDTTQGGGEQTTLSQTFGRSWGSGNVVAGYTYDRQDHIDNADREETARFTQLLGVPDFLIPDTTEQSAMLLVSQELGEVAELYLDGFYSNRETESSRVANHNVSESDQVSVAGGVRVKLGGGWKADFDLQYAEFSDDLTIDVPNPPVVTTTDDKFRIRTLEAKTDGPLFTVPGGTVRLAVGGQVREEDLTSVQVSFGQPLPDERSERKVLSAYSELYVPLVGPDNARPGIAALDFSIAGRYEDYDDFGSEFVPKIGVAWAPVESLTLRGTWGRSFRAPRLTELLRSGILTGVFVFSTTDPQSPFGFSPVLSQYGTVAGLHPEKSDNWTVGIDFSPVPGLDVSVTYFDIEFTDRIASPSVSLEEEAIWTDFITRRPADAAGDAAFQAQVDALLALPPPTLVLDFSFGAPVAAIVDARTTNLAVTRDRGMDLDLGYHFDTGLGRFGVNVGATYVLEQGVQPVSGAEFTEDYEKHGRPVALRLRNNFSWSRNRTSANVLVNHSDSYRDGRFGFEDVRIGSWTTVDASLSVSFEGDGLIGGTQLVFSGVNLFDKAPPFVSPVDPLAPIYDAANASAVGRRLSLHLTKTW